MRAFRIVRCSLIVTAADDDDDDDVSDDDDNSVLLLVLYSLLVILLLLLLLSFGISIVEFVGRFVNVCAVRLLALNPIHRTIILYNMVCMRTTHRSQCVGSVHTCFALLFASNAWWNSSVLYSLLYRPNAAVIDPFPTTVESRSTLY